MKSTAWLMDCDDGLQVAVGEREMVELVRQRDCHPAPGTAEFYCGVLQWQGHAVPVLDISRLHGAQLEHDDAYISLLNYRDSRDGELRPIGIRVTGAPRLIVVDDDQVCTWPPDLATSPLRAAALCCFEHDDRTVLILDIARLCSAEFREVTWVA